MQTVYNVAAWMAALVNQSSKSHPANPGLRQLSTCQCMALLRMQDRTVPFWTKLWNDEEYRTTNRTYEHAFYIPQKYQARL